MGSQDFAGSGTTPVSCIEMNRKYIAYELNKEYYEIAKARIKHAEKQLYLDFGNSDDS